MWIRSESADASQEGLLIQLKRASFLFPQLEACHDMLGHDHLRDNWWQAITIRERKLERYREAICKHVWDFRRLSPHLAPAPVLAIVC